LLEWLDWFAELSGSDRLADIAEAGFRLSANGFAGPRRVADQALETVRNLSEVAAKANRGELVVKLTAAQLESISKGHSRQTGRVVRAVLGAAILLTGVQLLIAGTALPVGIVLAALGGLAMVFQLPARRGRRSSPRR
jgi:hypothetical protein